MDEGNRNGSLAHRRRHALETASSDIAYREHSGQTCFEEMRSASERPLSGVEILGRQVWSGLDESVRVQRNASVQPMCIWNSTGHDEDVPYIVCLHISAYVISPVYALQMITASKSCNLGLCS